MGLISKARMFSVHLKIVLVMDTLRTNNQFEEGGWM